MGTRRFGQIEFDPVKNPAVLDTATWDPEGAWDIVESVQESDWQSVRDTGAGKAKNFENEHCMLYAASHARHQENDVFLAKLCDDQQVLLEVGGEQQGESVLGDPVGTRTLANNQRVTMYPSTAEILDRFCRKLLPEKGPRALGSTPRIGIGVRMSTSVWPGIWQAMEKYSFAANAIQNSLRELNMLEDVLAGKTPHSNYLFSFGNIDEGHTGSTFEGLWTYGVLSALRSATLPRYGADADHIMVKRGPEGLDRAKRVIDSGRYYSFFTLDVSDILNYGAINEPSQTTAEAFLPEVLGDAALQKSILAYHGQPRRIGGQEYAPDKAMIGRLVGKYWKALDATEALYEHLKELKQGVPFDLELSVDENPPEVRTCESLTKDVELMFLLLEVQRRQVPISHIAPNFGVEKGVDYRCPGGLEELEARVRRQYQMATEYGLMLDCHSGDDLKSPTRQVFGRATKGNIHFKVSPSLQVLFGETLNDLYPELFQFWWDDTLAYAKREAEGGAQIAVESLRDYEGQPNPVPSARTPLFEHFNFATVGKRDAQGQFLFREKFYDLPAAFYQEYTWRVEQLLGEVAKDVFQ